MRVTKTIWRLVSVAENGVDKPSRLRRFVPFVHLPFSVQLLDLFVASLVFVKGTSCCVTRSRVEPLDRAMANVYLEVIDFRCYLHVASWILTPP